MAAPTKIEDRTEYSTSLNSIASVIMHWYGSLITNNENIHFSSPVLDDKWQKYREQYPDEITQVIIKDTDLLKVKNNNNNNNNFTNKNKYQFQTTALITFKKDNKLHTQSLNETFVFEANKSKQAVIDQLTIKSIKRNKSENVKLIEATVYNRSHYKVREFVYAWLAYLDGVKSLTPVMNAKAWLDTAPYSIEMGIENNTGTIPDILKQRKKLLTKGGHLLRSLNVEPINDKTFIVNLELEWKGVNEAEKPVAARIRQLVEIKIEPDNSWKVISIKEKHLLPNIAPWTGMLC